MKKILLAVDRGGLAESVVPAVVALAADPQARVVALHVVDPSAPDSSWLDAAHVISDVVVRLAREGVEAEGQARDGSRREVAAQIVAAAEEIGADLIALGSHGRGDITGILFGSVGHKVAAMTGVPLLIARPTPSAETAQTLRRLLVAVDRTPESQAAVDLAGAIARQSGAEIRLVHALANVVVEAGAYIEPEESASADLERLAAPLRRQGVVVRMQLLDGFGPAAARIAAAATAWNADLVVIGSRRLGEFSALVSGSTSHALLAESDRPVLIAGKPSPKE